jgi:hypothetical protein
MKQINLYLRINTLFSYLLGKLLIPRFLNNVSELLLTPSPKNTLVKYFKEMKAHNFRVAALSALFFIGNMANVMAQPQCTPNIITETPITLCAGTPVTVGIAGQPVVAPPVVTIRWEYRQAPTMTYTAIKTVDAPFAVPGGITAAESLTAAELATAIGGTVGEFRVRRTVLSPSTNCTESSKEVIITVVPYPAFTFINVPGDIVVSCFDKIPVGMFLGATNGTTAACTVGAGATGVITGSAEGTCGGMVTETWTYTDLAGRTITASRKITRTPAALGVIASQPDITAPKACGTVLIGSKLTKVGVLCVSGYTTDLSTFSEEPGFTFRCGGYKRETWAGKDSCGRVMAPVSRLIFFAPALKPTLAPAPPNIMVTGKNVATSELAYDNGLFGPATGPTCQVKGKVTSILEGTLDPICGGLMTEVWKYTDPCDGSVQTATRSITILPAELPVFKDEAGNIIPVPTSMDGKTFTATSVTLPSKTVDCGEAATSSITFTNASKYAPLPAGNCLVAGVISSTIGPKPGLCGGTYTETWKYFLPCPAGNTNFITFTRVNTVNPVKEPVFAAVPNIEKECVTITDLTANSLSYTNGEIGACLVSGSVLSTFEYKAGTDLAKLACGYTIIEKWTINQTCNDGLIVKTREIKVLPAKKPAFGAVSNIIVPCGTVVGATTLGYTNGLTGTCAITGTATSTVSAQAPLGKCGGTIIETWTATDVCGTVITTTRNITVLPAALPTITNTLVGKVLPCGFNAAELTPRMLPYTNGLTDGCSLAGTTTMSTFSATPGACGGTITETFTATDLCGRVITSTVIHTVQPAALPTMVAPANGTKPQGFDCGATPLGSTLPYKNTLTGGCEIKGTSDVSTFAPTNPLTACSIADGYWMTETWEGTDCAGRPLIPVSRQVWRKPAMKPVMEVLPVLNVNCNPTLIPIKDVKFSNGLTGDCKIEGLTTVLSTFSAQVPAGSCGGKIVETFTYTYCGNTVTGTRDIIVRPADLPLLLAVDNPILRENGIIDYKKDTTFACGSDVNALLPLTFMGFSNSPGPNLVCDISGVSSNKSTRTAYVANSCGGFIIETWTATDGCNRPLASYSRRITILPAAKAIMTAQPNLNLECLIKPSKLVYTNSFLAPCISTGMSNMSTITRDVPVSGIHNAGCNNGTWTETWTATDECGRVLAPVSRKLFINDVTKPTSVTANTSGLTPSTRAANTMAPINLTCFRDTVGKSASPLNIRDAVDNCDSLVVVTVVSVTNNAGLGTTVSPWIQTRTYQLTDRCGNVTGPITEIMTVSDGIAPVVLTPIANKVVVGTKLNGDCTYLIPDYRSSLVVSDNCGTPKITQSPAPGSLVINNDRTLFDQSGSLIVLFTATDASGNIVTSSFVLTVNCAAPLAVNIASFSGVKTGEKESTLSWVTSSEVDFKEFQIQKSNDAVNFEGIGTIAGTVKQTTNLLNYQFVDNNSIGTNYYRLKMIDKDGSFDYSKIISTEGNENSNLVGQFYPNPTSGNNVSIDIYTKEAGVWKIESIDMLGRSVSTTEATLNKGANKVEVNVSTFNYGLNFIKIGSKDGSFTRKMFKN